MRSICGIFAILTAFLVSVMPAQTQGVPISYTITGIGSGSIGASPFTSQPFTLTILADMSNVQLPFPNSYAVNNTSATMQIGAVTTPALAGSSYASTTFFGYSGGVVGDEIDTFPVYVSAPGLTGYNLQAPVGPLSATPSPAFFLQTDLGYVTINSFSQVSFQATIPEPTAALVFAAVALTPICLRRRR